MSRGSNSIFFKKHLTNIQKCAAALTTEELIVVSAALCNIQWKIPCPQIYQTVYQHVW